MSSFSDAYWASQPLAIQALKGNADATQWQALALAGYTIDVPIMVNQWDALTVMTIRQNDGLSWVPSALQPVIGFLPTGGDAPFNPYDPFHPPAGSIRVSTNIADYPPLIPPTPPAPPATNVVGLLAFGTLYYPGPGAMANGKPTVTDGQQVQQDGATYTAHVTAGLMGVSVSFTKD